MITQSELKQILDYNPDTGIFTWKINTKRKRIGSIAGNIEAEGYRVITINNKSYKAHRLALLYFYDKYPCNIVDHINGIKDDNRICNIRECTQAENQWNAKLKTSNTSGIKGIHWCNSKKRWQAKIQINGKRKHIGYFKDIKMAENLLIEIRNSLHKEFANHGYYEPDYRR